VDLDAQLSLIRPFVCVVCLLPVTTSVITKANRATVQLPIAIPPFASEPTSTNAHRHLIHRLRHCRPRCLTHIQLVHSNYPTLRASQSYSSSQALPTRLARPQTTYRPINKLAINLVIIASCTRKSLPSSVGANPVRASRLQILTYTGPFNREVSQILRLHNPHSDPVGFKVSISSFKYKRNKVANADDRSKPPRRSSTSPLPHTSRLHPYGGMGADFYL
jgi:hypothetical protein